MEGISQLEFENTKMENLELTQDIEDLLFCFHQILGILGLELSDLSKFDDDTLKKVIKAVKSKIMMAVGDQDSFVELFKPFANDAARLGAKYESKIQAIANERAQ